MEGTHDMSGIRGFLVTAILALAGGAWAGGGAIALIPGAGERSPDGALMATLETALLTDPSLTMVEREHIQKILAEQALAAGGFEAREQRLQLGKILGAAVLIFVDKVPGSTPSASVVRVTDSRTGIILDSWTIQDSEAKAQAAQWPETMKAALAKSRLPPAKRRAVGLLEFRSEESGTALESLADGMGELLMAELGRAPTVLVLDREHLDHLRAEKALSAMDQELKSSAWMIEAGLRRTGQNGELDVALSVRPLTGAQPVSQTVSVRRGDMLAASRALAAAVAKLVQTDPPAASGTSTNEASTYARQVSVWGRWGWNDTGKALRAAEAAYALAPSLDNVNALVAALGAHHLTLRNAVRMQSLLLDYYQRLPALVAEGATTNLVLPASEYYYGALGYRGPPKDHVESAEDAQQRAELLDLEEKVFRFQVAYYKQHYAQLGEEYWWAWARRLGGRSTIWVGPADGNLRAYAPGHPDRQVALIREAVETFLNPPARPDWYPASRLMVLMVVPTQLAPFFKYEDHGYRVVYEADVEKPFRELMEEYTRHKDPLVRFMAHYGLVNNYGELCQVAGSAPSKVELMRLMVEDIPPSHPARATVTNGVVGLFHGGYENDRILLRRCCATIGLLAPNAQWEHWPAWLVEKELDGYAALFRSAIDTRDAGRCFVFERETIFNRLDSLAFYGRTNQAIELAQAILELSDRDPGGRQTFSYPLRALIDKYRGGPAKAPTAVRF